MNQIDWSLLIGYIQEDAETYLQEECVPYRTTIAMTPKKSPADATEFRVIAVRKISENEGVELICAVQDWSVI